MKVIKPAWVSHARQQDEHKALPIYCLHVHPDCSRLATGGLDSKVRIWSTLPILDEQVAAKEENPKLLCTLGTHNGAVLTVRWAHHGRYLASGSDDGVVLIWDLDLTGGGKVWGSDDVNVENWKALKRLVGHESDIADVAWSSDDSMLASVGLDSTIFIWDGYTFEKLRKIDSHGGFVKGVCWDPIGEYLATQSDDRTVKIWNTEDWSCRATVGEPFKRSPGNTFFRRLSWSPDGNFIVASNAMNGPVFVAAVIEREDWLSDVSFVGHENTIQVAAFNPRLLFPPDVEKNRTNASSMVALGGDDNSISIWRNTRKAPLVVLKELFERQILDLCWANDGLSIYGCSSDGTICAIQFDAAELPDLAEPEATTKLIETERQRLARPMRRMPPPPNQASMVPLPPAHQTTNGFGAMPSEQVINQLTAKQKVTILPGGKRRIQPALLASLSSTQVMNPSTVSVPVAAQNGQTQSSSFDSNGSQGIFSGALDGCDGQVRRDQLMANVGPAEGRTLGGDRPKENAPPREIRPAYVASPASTTSMAGTSTSLPIPVVQEKLISKCDGDENIWVEAINSEASHNRITTYNRGATQWLDFAAHHIIGLAISQHSVAAAFEDGSVACYSLNGDRRIANMRLDAVVTRLHLAKHFLLAITARGTLHVWDVRAKKARFAPVSIAHLLQAAPSSSSSPTITLENAVVRPNGTPLLQLSNGSAFAFDASLSAWEEVSTVWWVESSSLFARGAQPVDPSRTVMASVEAHTGDIASRTQRSTEIRAKPQYWDEAISLGHLETRLRACALLDSPDEYRANLKVYAQKLADEGYTGKAEDLVRELHGPVYFNARNEQEWSPDVCGLRKRELLVGVLQIFAQSRSLSDLARRWQDRLRDAATEADAGFL